MDITNISDLDAKVTIQHEAVKWLYANGSDLTGPRWCFLVLPEGDTLISGMIGNPAGDNFEITENFRPANEYELYVLKVVEELGR